jgi:hypothetical protein
MGAGAIVDELIVSACGAGGAVIVAGKIARRSQDGNGAASGAAMSQARPGGPAGAPPRSYCRRRKNDAS